VSLRPEEWPGAFRRGFIDADFGHPDFGHGLFHVSLCERTASLQSADLACLQLSRQTA
jgi:hypothetical protein